jgi:hypothetical protein
MLVNLFVAVSKGGVGEGNGDRGCEHGAFYVTECCYKLAYLQDSQSGLERLADVIDKTFPAAGTNPVSYLGRTKVT